MIDFVNLHAKTHYSLLSALPSPKDLLKRAKELGQKATAITDAGSLASCWESYKLSKEIGIKLIIGIDTYFQDEAGSDEKFRNLVLLARNHQGYQNLLALNKFGFDQSITKGKKVYPIVDWKLLEKHADGLICLTGCGNGLLSALFSNGKNEEAENALLRLKAIFGEHLGVEILPNSMERFANFHSEKIDQRFLNRKLIDLGKKHNVSIVATCNALYAKKEDHDAHDVLLAIGSGQPIHSNFRIKYPVRDFYLKTGEEVASFFSRNYGEEFGRMVCQNAVSFSERCEEPVWIDPKFSNPSGKELPVFPVKDEPDYLEFLDWRGMQDANLQKQEEDTLYLRFKCYQHLEKFFFEKSINEEQKKEYYERVEKELDTLDYCGVSSYMLIVADYMQWCKKNDIMVGDGRGSAGGCFCGYLLGIHTANSVKYNLMFERFHNKQKVSYSDIDSDFSKENRHLVIDYIKKKYGKDYFSQISNINTITPKVYIKDVCRAIELGGPKEMSVYLGNDIAGHVSADPRAGIHTIDQARQASPMFAEYCEKFGDLLKYKDICTKPRAAGVHASGYVLCKRPIHQIVPVRKDKEGELTIEYGKEIAEENGLVKMDILGLSTLDIMKDTFELIKANGKEFPNINYETYDEKTYDLIGRGDTFCVFQFGISEGTINLCRKIKPKCLEDLALITALARPQAKEIREPFIKTRNAGSKFKPMHPSLSRAFSHTYGYPLYDESLLLLAKDVAGWDLAEADKLRKLTKEKGKNPEKVKKWKQEFIEGAANNKINKDIADKIWEEICVPFGRYAFNLSHSILYSITSFKTAYLKAHFPIEFLLANLMQEVKSNAKDAKNNLEKIKTELRANGVEILPPDINLSQMQYSLSGNALLTGLDALKFVGEDAIKDILAKRPFQDFNDFMLRVSSSKVKANTISALAASGALDKLGIDRKSIILYCSDYRKKLQVWLKKHDPTKENFTYPWEKNQDWTLGEKYALEQRYLGEGFICKPFLAYGDFFKGEKLGLRDIQEAEERSKLAPIKAIIKSMFECKVKKEGSKFIGRAMVIATLEDANGQRFSCTIFPDSWDLAKSKVRKIAKVDFAPGVALSFSGTVNIYDDQIGVILNDIFDAAPPPKVPADLKAKKVKVKGTKERVKEALAKTNDVKTIVEELEDSLFDDGLVDLEQEEDLYDLNAEFTWDLSI